MEIPNYPVDESSIEAADFADDEHTHWFIKPLMEGRYPSSVFQHFNFFALSFIVTGLVWQWILNPEYGVEKIIRSIGFESFVFNPLYNTDIVIYGILAAGLWQGTGFIMCLMLAGLRGIDQEIWKAAKIDGIPMWKTYIQVVIPMMRPIFITTLVIIAAGIIKVYDLVVALWRSCKILI